MHALRHVSPPILCSDKRSHADTTPARSLQLRPSLSSRSAPPPPSFRTERADFFFPLAPLLRSQRPLPLQKTPRRLPASPLPVAASSPRQVLRRPVPIPAAHSHLHTCGS